MTATGGVNNLYGQGNTTDVDGQNLIFTRGAGIISCSISF